MDNCKKNNLKKPTFLHIFLSLAWLYSIILILKQQPTNPKQHPIQKKPNTSLCFQGADFPYDKHFI